MRTITILNQGKGFEPNSTMAVLHYPIEPHAYWTFDRHETLFEDKREARHQPSPAWNREINIPQLIHYWTFDNNDSGVFDLESSVSLTEDKFQFLGLLGNALQLNNAEVNASQFLDTIDQNFTLSMWVKPGGDFNISISDSDTNQIKEYELAMIPTFLNSLESFWVMRVILLKYLPKSLTIGLMLPLSVMRKRPSST